MNENLFVVPHNICIGNVINYIPEASGNVELTSKWGSFLCLHLLDVSSLTPMLNQSLCAARQPLNKATSYLGEM